MNPGQWVGAVFVCVLPRLPNWRANGVMCVLLNEPERNIFVKTMLQVVESVFLSFVSRNVFVIWACFGGVDSSY